MRDRATPLRKERAIPTGLASAPARLTFDRTPDGKLLIKLGGAWQLTADLPHANDLDSQLESPGITGVGFDSTELTDWDSSLATLLSHVAKRCADANIPVDWGDLPQGIKRLIDLASTVPETVGARKDDTPEGIVTRVGEGTIKTADSVPNVLRFIGEAVVALFNFVRGRARFRGSDLALFIQQAGVEALPIVSLISLLMGLIVAYIGALQLRQFGAEIWIANGVAIGMTRYMGPMMTAIIMAGRTGASYAAQLGTMTVNEEVDALETLGVPPMEFLVLPRMLALILMLPLLTLYSDFVGMIGGMIVGTELLDIGAREYFMQSRRAIGFADFVAGLIMASTFGVLIAIAGCYKGIRSGRSAAGVGAATTAAVVVSIVLIVVTTAIYSVIFNVLGI